MQNRQRKRSITMHSTGAFRCRIPTDEAILAMKDLSSNAYKLLIYYYSKSTGWKFDDAEMAEVIGITDRTLKDCKRELIAKGYLHIEKGGSIDNYFIGKQSVFQWKNPDIGDCDEQ